MFRLATPFILSIPIVIYAPVAQACTIFMAEGDGVVLAGNNEDYYLDVTSMMWVTKGKKGEHGRVCFGFKRKPFSRFAQGGMNDAGLFFDAAVTPRGPEPVGDGKAKAPSNMGDRMLAECATVSEAVAWLGKYKLNLLRASHLLLADATGDAAVVELVDGAMKVFPKEGSYQVVTNFALANPGAGNYPCIRYAMANQVLGAHREVSIELVRNILQGAALPRTHIDEENRDGGTLYSNVYDLTHRIVHIYREREFDAPIAIDLRDYIKRGSKTYRLDELSE